MGVHVLRLVVSARCLIYSLPHFFKCLFICYVSLCARVHSGHSMHVEVEGQLVDLVLSSHLEGAPGVKTYVARLVGQMHLTAKPSWSLSPNLMFTESDRPLDSAP